jgi:hypothetical protein
MRNIVELLELMLENEHRFYLGLCTWAQTLLVYKTITFEEHQLLSKFILDNPPSKWSFDRIWYWPGDSDGFYWEYGEIAPRRRWIKRHINLLTKKK